jgi:hypothetical protein
MLDDQDTMQGVAPWLTREEAGRKLALLCKAGAEFVKAADRAEDAGHAAIWLCGPPMWDIHRVCARIDARWGQDVHAASLAHVLKSLATAIDALVECETIKHVFERRFACARQQASMLGCHRLLVLDPPHFLFEMEQWVRKTTCNDTEAYAAVRLYGKLSFPTQLVLVLLKELGLVPRRGRGMRCSPDPGVHAVHQDKHEPLWNREYVASSLSSRGWV